ncbi:MAG: quinone-interacting membrane-bound oxidoreductase complex subunit QmoC [Nitrospirae bacterium]|nr:quinone-interacting membrane-bound oxidoreductase complex subunit QmoC [Nitrospirota bacterium]
MSEATLIKPDLDFVKGVMASGGESLKKCYQCATCSVVCNVTPDKNPFPRKEMIWAQWGLKEKFIGNPDVWLCHQCNDCTAYCPRGAKPGEVLGAIRKQTISQYSKPGFLVNIVNNKALVWLIFLIPALVLGLVLSADGTFIPTEGELIFSNFASTFQIQMVFVPAFMFGAIVGLLGMMSFFSDMKKANNVSSGDLMGSIMAMAGDIISHSKFKSCDVSKDRYLSHLLVFFSFILLGIATAIGVLYIDILHIESPFELFGTGAPVKIFGLAGAIGLFLGVLLMIKNRYANAAKVGLGSYFDWLLITIIGVIMASGILAWITRVAGMAGIAYPVYFIHLVFIFSLFVYLPYSKLAHIYYRSAAICFNKYSGREKK